MKNSEYRRLCEVAERAHFRMKNEEEAVQRACDNPGMPLAGIRFIRQGFYDAKKDWAVAIVDVREYERKNGVEDEWRPTSWDIMKEIEITLEEATGGEKRDMAVEKVADWWAVAGTLVIFLVGVLFLFFLAALVLWL